MATIPSPNMNLPIPVVGQEAGPDYAQDVNNSLTIVDQHNHSPGSGVQISPAGININTALTFNTNFATGLAGLTLVAQSSTPAVNTIYESGVDLYYVDGLGNNIQITKNGGVAGSPGSISNLTSPASATYVSASSTFVWQSDVSKAANMDAGSLLMRNLTPNSTFALTLQPPSALGNNYSLTLPNLPGSLSLLTIDTSGNIAGSISVSGGITGSSIAANTITSGNIALATITEANMAPLSIGTPELINGSVTQPKRAALGQQISSGVSSYSPSSSDNPVPGLSISITTTGRPVWIGLIGNGLIGDLSVSSGLLVLQLVRNSTLVYGAEMGSPVNGISTFVPQSSFQTIDTPSAGTYTYTVLARYDTVSSGGAAIEQCRLCAYEL